MDATTRVDLDIDCVIVGHNCEKTLPAAIESARNSQYTRGKVHIYYLDQHSTDQSVEIARRFDGVEVVELGRKTTLQEAQKVALEKGKAPLIQFLEADATLSPSWFQEATKDLGDAAFGHVKMADDGSFYSWVMALDEQYQMGSQFLVRRDRYPASKATAIDTLMARRPGHKHGFEEYWRWAVQRRGDGTQVWVRGGLPILLVLLGLLFSPVTLWSLALFLPAAILLLYPRIFRVEALAQELHLSHHDAARYAWHRSFVVLPQLFGRFFKARH